MEKVSVILPYYNRSDVLAVAVRSVLGQTHSDLILFLVDDGSSDGSDTVAKDFTDSRIVHVDARQNLGVSGARNLGLSRVESDLVAFMDSDDQWLPTKLEVQIALLRKKQREGFDASVVGSGWLPERAALPQKSFKAGPFQQSQVFRGVAGLGTPMLLIDRARAAITYFDVNLPALVDRDYVLGCLRNGSVVVVATECLALVSRGRSDHVASPDRAARAWEVYITKYEEELAQDARLRSWFHFRAGREYLIAGQRAKAASFLREALRDRGLIRSIHLFLGAVGGSKGLGLAQKLFPGASYCQDLWIGAFDRGLSAT